MITLIFDDLEDLKNCLDLDEQLSEGIHRFTTSTYANHLKTLSVYQSSLGHPSDNNLTFHKKDYSIQFLSIDDKWDGKYIIPIGVNQSPREWMCDFYDDSPYKWKNIFNKLPARYLKDLQQERAYLMIDNALEGYHSNDIFTYLYDGAINNFIPPQNIIYVTGNLNIENNLKEWCVNNRGKIPIEVIPYAHFEYDIGKRIYELLKYDTTVLPTTATHYNHKEILGLGGIKLYNFLNKKPRDHRIWTYVSLSKWNLLQNGIVSMNPAEHNGDIYIDYNLLPGVDISNANKTLPIYAYGDNTNDKEFEYYMYNYNQAAMLDSWISIVSETHFDDSQKTCFLSEKTFKTIATQTPFMILGNRGSLKKLQDMGYKTFHDIIDEGYDDLESIHRINAIIDELRRWESNPNKFQQYNWLAPRLEHNVEVMKFNALFNPPPKFFRITEMMQ